METIEGSAFRERAAAFPRAFPLELRWSSGRPSAARLATPRFPKSLEPSPTGVRPGGTTRTPRGTTRCLRCPSRRTTDSLANPPQSDFRFPWAADFPNWRRPLMSLFPDFYRVPACNWMQNRGPGSLIIATSAVVRFEMFATDPSIGRHAPIAVAVFRRIPDIRASHFSGCYRLASFRLWSTVRCCVVAVCHSASAIPWPTGHARHGRKAGLTVFGG